MAFIVIIFFAEVSKIRICFHCIFLKHFIKAAGQISVSL